MVVFPNAKINLGLYITEKRPDGYHNLLSCFLPVPWCDVLEIVPAKKTTFESTGIPIPGNPKENLCLKAFQALNRDYGLDPVTLHLHKVIPIGAGLGGGSADASFTLRLLNEMSQLFLDDSILEMYAADLGSDCPFFIGNQPAIATGTGDELEPLALDLKGWHLALVNPGIHIGTKEAYAGVTPKDPGLDLGQALTTQPVETWKDWLHNDFEDSIFPQHPAIAELKQRLYDQGATYASMSGSGATVFGLFPQAPALSGLFPPEYTVFEAQL